MKNTTRSIARKSTGTLGIFLGCFLFYLVVRQFQK